MNYENYFNQGGGGNYPSCANVSSDCPCVYDGCMDPTASNYDANATCDDGSCVAWVTGCMDPTAFNYSPTATQDDGSCVPVVMGCTTFGSLNHDPNANTDDGSCIAPVPGCMDQNAYNYNPNANTPCAVAPPPPQSFSGTYSNFNTGFTPNPNAPMTISTSHHLSAAGTGFEPRVNTKTWYEQNFQNMVGTPWQRAGYRGTAWQETY